MVNVYEKSGFKNPSIPKPAGGYSSTVKPASAPMRQGGLSQLAAKAAMQGRQPSVGNPPVPDTGRGVFQPRAYEAPPPQDRNQELPGGYRPSLAPQVTPQRGGMIDALGQQRIAPQGQSRGMLAAAAEAPPRTPYTAPVVQIPGAGIDYAQGLADFYAQRGDEGLGTEGGEYGPATGPWGSHWQQQQTKRMLEAWGKAGKDALPYDLEASQIANKKASLIAGGMSPQMADLIMELEKDEYGLSDEELTKQISEGAGIQAEMMAARGLGASGLAGTGFGDIYSQVLSDNEQLALQEKVASQNLLAQLLTSEDKRKAAGVKDAEEFASEIAIKYGSTKIHPDVELKIEQLRAEGKTDAEIMAMFTNQNETLIFNKGGLANYAAEGGSKAFVKDFGSPPWKLIGMVEGTPEWEAQGDKWDEWVAKVMEELDATEFEVMKFLDDNGFTYTVAGGGTWKPPSEEGDGDTGD